MYVAYCICSVCNRRISLFLPCGVSREKVFNYTARCDCSSNAIILPLQHKNIYDDGQPNWYYDGHLQEELHGIFCKNCNMGQHGTTKLFSDEWLPKQFINDGYCEHCMCRGFLTAGTWQHKLSDADIDMHNEFCKQLQNENDVDNLLNRFQHTFE